MNKKWTGPQMTWVPGSVDDVVLLSLTVWLLNILAQLWVVPPNSSENTNDMGLGHPQQYSEKL